MSASRALRARTASSHEAVDAAFGRFDLTDRIGYAAALTAHYRALAAVEAALADLPDLPAWRPRAALLADDLAALGHEAPAPLAFKPEPGATAWGALYVIEGSRLGNAMLVRSVPTGWPAAYMGARHDPGEWRTLLAAIDAAAGDDTGWTEAAVAGAERVFALYARAATAT